MPKHCWATPSIERIYGKQPPKMGGTDKTQPPASAGDSKPQLHRRVRPGTGKPRKSRKVAPLAQIPALDSRVLSITDAQGCSGERHRQEAQGGAARDMKAAIDQWPARPASQPRLASPRCRLLPSPWRNGNKQNLGDRLGVSGSALARSTHFQLPVLVHRGFKLALWRKENSGHQHN